MKRGAKVLKTVHNSFFEYVLLTTALRLALQSKTIFLFSDANKKPKKYFCIFCKKKITKFARHLENIHNNEDEVCKFIFLPKGNDVLFEFYITMYYKVNLKILFLIWYACWTVFGVNCFGHSIDYLC